MDQYLLFLLVGLGTGAIFAALALGIVLAYKGSGVINFAHGAMAGYIAYTYDALRSEGELVVPPLPNPLAVVEGIANRWLGQSLDLPDFPTFIDLGGRQTFLAALFISLAVAALLGLLLHLLVFRPLRYAPTLAKVVAAVGIMLMLQATLGLRFGTTPRNVQAILPTDGIEVFGGRVAYDRFILAAIIVALAASLWALFRFTRFGLATRAASENEKAATLLGFSPDFLAGASWVLATVLAGLVGILAAPVTSLTPFNYTLFIIPALGAALLASFRSFAIAAGAGLLLGMLDQLLVLVLTKDWWKDTPLPEQGARQALPFLVLIAAIFLRGKSLPTRGAIVEGRLPFSPRPAHVLPGSIVVVVAVSAGLLVLGFDYRSALMTSLIGSMIALSLVVLVGFVGQISLAQMSIAGFAAFALTRLAGEWGVPFPVGPLVAAAVATVAGVLVGLPALRVRGSNLAVITLALAYVLDGMLFNNRDLTGSTGADVAAPPPEIFGIRFGPFDPFLIGDNDIPTAGFGFFLLLLATLLCLAVVNLRRSPTGRHMLAVRSNERAAAAAGVNVIGTKIAAFAISSFVAGVAGVCVAYFNNGKVSPTAFAVFVSLAALATAYLGGISSVSGAVVAGALFPGGLVFHFFDDVAHLGPWEVLLGGLGLVVTAVVHPEGIAGGLRHAVHAIRGHHDPSDSRPPAADPTWKEEVTTSDAAS